MVIPEGNAPSPGKFSTFEMLLMLHSYERTEARRRVIRTSRISINESCATLSPNSVIEGILDLKCFLKADRTDCFWHSNRRREFDVIANRKKEERMSCSDASLILIAMFRLLRADCSIWAFDLPFLNARVLQENWRMFYLKYGMSMPAFRLLSRRSDYRRFALQTSATVWRRRCSNLYRRIVLTGVARWRKRC